MKRDALWAGGVMNLNILTGSTCGFACWQAHEDVCRCSCYGANHGIMREGGAQPKRTAKIKGEFFELVAVIPGPVAGEAACDAFHREDVEVARLYADRFPGVDTWQYGEYRPFAVLPVVTRKPSETQLRWPEVAAVTNPYRLVWARPVGSPYATKEARKVS